MAPTVFLSAAEASGDHHAARLIHALRERLAGARFVGVAGPEMAAAGCEVVADLTSKASMLGGPLLRLGYYYRQVRHAQQAIRDIGADIHVPVDSPALNWHLAAASKKAGTPVMYYVAPQVWAWAPWRVKKLAKLTDAVACILPFEPEYFRPRGVNATFVGHPVFDETLPAADPLPDLLEAWSEGTMRVALLPGSRPSELRHHSRALGAVAGAISARYPRSRCVFATLSSYSEKDVQAIREESGTAKVEFVTGREEVDRALQGCHFAVVGSGTVTLKAAHFGMPMVVFYYTSRMMRLLHATVGQYRSLVPATSFALINILAGRRIVPELMPWRGNARRLIEAVMELLDDLGAMVEVRQELTKVVDPLVVPAPRTAADNVADLVVDLLNKQG